MKTYTTSLGHELTIQDNSVSVVNKFGDIYKGVLVDGKLVCKSSLSLSVLTKAMSEFKNK